MQIYIADDRWHEKISSEHLIDEVLAARWHLLLDARLMEIDENLVRADLSPAERAAHHEERKRAWEREHPETRNVNVRGGPGPGNKTAEEFSTVSAKPYAEDAAEKLGVTSRTVRSEIARAKAIPNVIRVAGTSLDKPEELNALARLPEQHCESLIARATTGEKVSAKLH